MSKQEIYDRDNGICFYGGEKLTMEQATEEHLLAKAHGGSNSPHNIVLSCEVHNRAAGAMGLIDKIKMREQLLGWNNTKNTIVSIGDIHIEIREPQK